MAHPSQIRFDSTSRDFLINGEPLLLHLAKHEGINATMYQPALGIQPEAKARLLGDAEPDLVDGHVALYVCGMCGDYDGISIGVRVVLDEPDVVQWDDMGWHDDVDGWHSFDKVNGYRFDRVAYVAALRAVVAT